MGNYVHRETKIFYGSISNVALAEPEENYILDPDFSNVQGVSSKYWVITDDTIFEMSQEEKDILDATELSASRDSSVDAMIDNQDGDLRQLVKLLIREINILRSQHSLPDRTIEQFKAEIRNGYGS